MSSKKVPFIFRRFFHFWLAVVLPVTTLALLVSKLYYNNTINLEPLHDLNVWLHFAILQVFVSFFTYIWVYRQKAKDYRN